MQYNQCLNERVQELINQSYRAMQAQEEKKHLRKFARITSLNMLLAFGLMFLFSMAVSMLSVNSLSLESLTSGLDISYIIIVGLSNALTMIISAVIFSQIANCQMSELIPFEKTNGKKIFYLVFAGLGVCMIANLSVELLSMYFGFFGFDISGGASLELDSSLTGTLLSVISVAIVPALGEELLFRGAVLGYLRKYDDRLALLVSATLFGLFHGNFLQAPFAFIVGLALGYLVIYTNSLLPSMIIHFINNAYSTVISSVAENFGDEVANITAYTAMIIFLLVGFVSFYKLSLDDKNFGKFTDNRESLLTFREKCSVVFNEPFMVIFIIIMLGSCILTMFAGIFG